VLGSHVLPDPDFLAKLGGDAREDMASAPGMVLCRKNDPKRFVFANIAALKRGEVAELTLSSHRGMAVGRKYVACPLLP
jgi:hypothetical protein